MSTSTAPRTAFLPEGELAGAFGLRLSCEGMQRVLDQLERHVMAGGPPTAVFTANVDHALRIGSDPEFAGAYRSCAFATIDGMPLLWALKLLGFPVRERVAGIDVMYGLLRIAAGRGWRCYFLGAQEQTLADCIANLRVHFPELRIAGAHHGYFRDDKEMARKIAAASPDLVLVGMGSPRQEKWVARSLESLGAPLVLPVGGSFDVVAGRTTRAPRWLQRAGLEWTWRLLQEPRRLWRRYLTGGPRFMWLVARYLARRKESVPSC